MAWYSTSRHRELEGIACISVCWAGWGCGSGDGPKVGKVSGKVTLDGKPLAGALVTFMPEKGRSSSGRTNDAGQYELSYTFEQMGAAVGKHSVRITTATTDNAESPVAQEKLPAKYHRDTELKAEVKPGSNKVDFELSSQGAPSRTPTRRAGSAPTT